MGRYTFVLEIAAPREQVFDTWVDLDRMFEWIEGPTNVTDQTGSSDQAGSTYTIWFGRFPSKVKVLDAERPAHIRTELSSRILSATNDVSFDALYRARTRLSQTFETRGVVAAIWGRIFATGSYKGSFRAELNTFKEICEREAVASNQLRNDLGEDNQDDRQQ